MEDSFAYRTTVPLRRRVDPRLIRAAVGAVVVVVAIVAFASWVISSERRSFARRPPAGATAAPSASVPGGLAGPEPGATAADVQEALRLAADAARAAFAADGTFLAATPARLAALEPGYTFVDGPSTTASVVSVASTADAWAAAVLGPDGDCVWTIVSSHGTSARPADAECTGAAALASFARH